MVDATPSDPVERATGRSTRALLREVILTGVAVLVPVAITLYVLFVIFSALARLLTPAANLFPGSMLVGHLLAGLALVGLVVVVGLVAHFRTGKRAIDYFDAAVGRVPGVGAVYRSFRRMSDVMLDSDADHFREVKLVSFPGPQTYMLGFVTTRTPDLVVEATDEAALHTLFVPLAPNPVMGGFVVHVPDDHIYDIDLTVEEGFRATVTGGVAMGDDGVAADAFAGDTWELLSPARAAVEEVENLGELKLSDLRSWTGTDVEELTLGEVRELELADLEDRLFGDICEEGRPDGPDDPRRR
jgi:uncharacterized membrane protein